MSDPAASLSSWAEANQRCLMAELAVLRAALRRRAGEAEGGGSTPASEAGLLEEFERCVAAMPAPCALDQVCAIFGLSRFERAILLLCAGLEFDSACGDECAAAQPGERPRPHPTFSLALAALPEPHWSALTPNAPLRYWRLIELGSGLALTTSQIRIDERILHFLAGAPGMDERLIGCLELVGGGAPLAPAHAALARRVSQAWLLPAGARPPVIQLCGSDIAAMRQIAAEACAGLGIKLWRLPAERLPQAPSELESLQRLWEREAALAGGALLLEQGAGGAEADRASGPRLWAERALSPLVLAAAEPALRLTRPVLVFDAPRLPEPERRELWKQALGAFAAPLNGQLDRVVSHFDLGAPAIHTVCDQVIRQANLTDDPSSGAPSIADSLWAVCRRQSRARLDDLAQRIDTTASWDDLVLPERATSLLREAAAHAQRRSQIYDAWGFGAKCARGLGISALFSGPSGTGKTLAAEALANELQLDLYRIDLSQVVSKYIGETEKNLARVFDAAEASGAVLLFDEADALFGKRSEVKDSHDRYANIEVSYLLQRMEAYRGLAILTTNMKDALDAAFLRRIRFVISFPFPDAAARQEIWRRIFPTATPTQGLDAALLARLSVAGGNIRNIAVNAAFIAAGEGEPVRMRHLARAARTEFAKIEKSLPEAELGGWE